MFQAVPRVALALAAVVSQAVPGPMSPWTPGVLVCRSDGFSPPVGVLSSVDATGAPGSLAQSETVYEPVMRRLALSLTVMYWVEPAVLSAWPRIPAVNVGEPTS